MSKRKGPGISLANLKSKMIENYPVDLSALGCEDPLLITYKADFYTADVEAKLTSGSETFRGIARIIADNVTAWNLMIPLTNDAGEAVDEAGNILAEDAEPVYVAAPLEYDWIAANLGSDLLEAINHAMFEGTRPNPKSSAS